MSDKTPNRIRWDGMYEWGPSGILERLEKQYEKDGCRASYVNELYRIVDDVDSWKLWHWRLRIPAFLRLRRLLIDTVSGAMKADSRKLRDSNSWTVDECEIMSRVLFKLSHSPVLMMKRRHTFKNAAKAFANRGIEEFQKNRTNTKPHLSVLLHTYRAALAFKECGPEEVVESCGGPVPWIKNAREEAERDLQIAVRGVEMIPDPDERAWCYRELAELYADREDYEEAKFFLKQADLWFKSGESYRENLKTLRRIRF